MAAAGKGVPFGHRRRHCARRGLESAFLHRRVQRLGPLRSCKEDAEADLERLRAAFSRDELRLAAQRMMHALCQSGVSRTCGINVQYPWSRLILAGVKAVEVRKYPLGRYPSFIAEQDLFLIETPGRGSTQDADCAIDVGAPPDKACVIGVVRFSGCFSLPTWQSLASRTRLESRQVAGTIGCIWATAPSSAGWWAARREWNPCLPTRRQCSAGSVHVL